MEQLLVSVIVPVYNVEKYLRRCIDSIINQTYRNLEIILIDDGSPDNCGKICDDYAIKDKRIRVVHKKNEGVSAARNTGLDLAKGRYIAFIDSDDYVDKEYIETLYFDCINNDVDISVVGVNDIDLNNKILRNSPGKYKVINKTNALQELMLEKYIQSVIWGKLYRIDVLKEIRFNTKTKIAEDLEILYKLFDNATKICINTKRKLYFYTVREDSATTNKFNKDWKNEIVICQEIIDYMERVHPNLKKYAIRRYVRINITCITKILKYGKDEDYRDIEDLKNNIDKYKMHKYYKQRKCDIIKIFLIERNIQILRKLYKIKEG